MHKVALNDRTGYPFIFEYAPKYNANEIDF